MNDTPGARSSSPRKLGHSLDRLLGSLNAPTVDVLDAVFGRWEEIIGPDLAKHTRPASIDGEKLVVVADDPAWASELRWLENELLQRVSAVSGSDRLTGVIVRVQRRE